MVIGAGVLGEWSGYIVPGFEKKHIEQLPAAAIRYALNDERALLAEFCSKVYDTDVIKKMKID